MGGELDALDVAHPVEPGGERPRGRHPRVELAQRAGGGVARVGEGGLAGRHALLVQLREGGQRQVDLAPHLDRRGKGAASASMASGTVRDGAQVGGHVLADLAVAPRGPDRQPAVLVAQRHGQAVDLGLEHEAPAPSALPSPASAASFTTRACQARSSSSFLALASESMGSP